LVQAASLGRETAIRPPIKPDSCCMRSMSATAASVSAAQQTQKEMGNSAHADSMNVRSHLLTAGASLMALLFVSTVPVTLHSMQFRGAVRKLSAKPEDVSNHSAFGFLFELNGTEDRQQGIYRPELPRYPVSTMQVCNYGSERIAAGFSQLAGTPSYWSIAGPLVSPNQCYKFDPVLFGKHAVEGATLECHYYREGSPGSSPLVKLWFTSAIRSTQANMHVLVRLSRVHTMADSSTDVNKSFVCLAEPH